MLAYLRNSWRGLTSMRTALVLLFLLALAALPGALLPQYPLNASKVADYKTAHGLWGTLLDKLGFFNVFAAPWFAAIYLLLSVSLIGCVVPRSVDHLRALRSEPVPTPRNLSRLPHHASSVVDVPVDGVLATARARLRGWRTRVREEPGGVATVSAEKGFLHEAGNLAFHVSLIGLLVGIALGKLFGYEGQVIVLADGSQFCNSGILGYDSFTAGLKVDGTDLAPFCLKVDSFAAHYLPSGESSSFAAQLGYQTGTVESGPWTPYTLEVNHPLRVEGDRVYLLGHGYAPKFTVTFPDGAQRVGLVQWRAVDGNTLLSEGAVKIDPPGVTSEAVRRRSQLAITGLFAPTSSGGALVTSIYPAPDNPEVAVDVYRGDLGLDSGRPQSIFSIDQGLVDSGRLVRVARQNLRPGQQLRLDDGTTVRFDGAEQWVSLQVSHDPAQTSVLVFAVLALVGLVCSLTVKRRRFWLRVSPRDGTGSVVEVGGLARTDQAGYGEEFTRLCRDLIGLQARKEVEHAG